MKMFRSSINVNFPSFPSPATLPASFCFGDQGFTRGLKSLSILIIFRKGHMMCYIICNETFLSLFVVSLFREVIVPPNSGLVWGKYYYSPRKYLSLSESIFIFLFLFAKKAASSPPGTYREWDSKTDFRIFQKLSN